MPRVRKSKAKRLQILYMYMYMYNRFDERRFKKGCHMCASAL